MVFLYLIVIAALVFLIYTVRIQNHEKEIHRHVKSLGGEVLTIERRMFSSRIGPFYVKGEGKIIYKFIYHLDGFRKEGWVRFGSLMGPDWRL